MSDPQLTEEQIEEQIRALMHDLLAVCGDKEPCLVWTSLLSLLLSGSSAYPDQRPYIREQMRRNLEVIDAMGDAASHAANEIVREHAARLGRHDTAGNTLH